MSKLIAKFDTIPVNPEIDPTGGYLLRLRERPVYDESQVFEEVVKEKTLPFDKDMLEFAFLAVLKTMALKVSRDCNPRKVGNYLKFSPTLRGKVKGMYSAYNPATCTSAITISSMKGLEKAVDENFVSFVNSREGVAVTILKICTLGEQDAASLSTITKGKPVICVGTNLQYLEGDKVEIHWKNAEDTDISIEVVPTESDIAHMTFAWPEALDELPDGTNLQWKFWTRGGLEDSDPQTTEKTVMLIEDMPEPSVTKVATTGKDGIVKGQSFEANGTNLGFNFATDHVSVTWMEGEEQKQAAIVPLSATADKIMFNACPLFDELPNDTELKFEFELGGQISRAVTTLKPNEPHFTGTTPPSPMTVHNDEDERMTINGFGLPVPTVETPLTEFKLEFSSDTPVFDKPYHFVFNEYGADDPHAVAFDECTSEALVIKTQGIAHDFQESVMPSGTPVSGTLKLTLNGTIVLEQCVTFVKV